MNMNTTFILSIFLTSCLLSFGSFGMEAATAQILNVPIPGKQSILRTGALPDQVTEAGQAMAQLMMDGLEKNDKTYFHKAQFALNDLIGRENIGGSYSAFRWILDVLLAPDEKTKSSFITNALDQHYYDYFFENDFANLKEYLLRKYKVNNFMPNDGEYHLKRSQFLEDLIVFNNPNRSSWDSVDAVMDVIKELGPGIKRVIDVGAGFGFYSTRLADIVGEDGVVYAVDTSQSYIDFMNQEILKKYPLGNIVPVLSTEDDVKVTEETDLVFISSLYHVLYTWNPFTKRDAFLKTVKQSLRDDGYLVILDNNYNGGLELHDSYIEEDYVKAQLYFYGFNFVEHKRLSDSRYVLVFQKAAHGKAKPPVFSHRKGGRTIIVSDAQSVVHVGSLDSFDITPAGIMAAKHLYRALAESDMNAAWAAITIYDQIIPKENFGGEYTALRWLAKYLLASKDKREAMIKSPLIAGFIEYLSADNYRLLKHFLARKYKFGTKKISVEEAADEETKTIGYTRRKSLEDFILFNNPERESWEKSSSILEKMPLKAGDTIVDVGSGPGYFSFKFSDIVGDSGKVYAMDTKKEHVDYMKSFIKKWEIKNVIPNLSYNDDLGLQIDAEADVVFMCSLYHIIYAVSSVHDREGMLNSIKNALKPGGKLVIVDNGPVDKKDIPYHGPYVRKELLVAQLAEYGFTLEQYNQIIPQRYMLVFNRR
jgi:SAM-dependent methyltransferase